MSIQWSPGPRELSVNQSIDAFQEHTHNAEKDERQERQTEIVLKNTRKYDITMQHMSSGGMTRDECLYYIQCMIVVFTYYNVAP